MATQADVTLSPVVVGDTMRARTVTFTINGQAPVIESAEFHLSWLYDCECPVDGATVTIPQISPETTKEWAAGSHNWDLRLTFGGVTKTYLRGVLPVLPSED